MGDKVVSSRFRPKRTIIDGIDPKLWEGEFGSWMRSDVVPMEKLLVSLETRSFSMASDLIQLASDELIRLHPPHIAALKRRIAERIKAQGGEWRGTAFILRSADGCIFTVHLPDA